MVDVLLAIASRGVFPGWFVLVYVVGFVAAVTIGLTAWFNSKRPAGWEGTERPSIIPKLGNYDDRPAESTPDTEAVAPASPEPPAPAAVQPSEPETTGAVPPTESTPPEPEA